MGELYMAESQTGEDKRIFRVSERRAPREVSTTDCLFFSGHIFHRQISVLRANFSIEHIRQQLKPVLSTCPSHSLSPQTCLGSSRSPDPSALRKEQCEYRFRWWSMLKQLKCRKICASMSQVEQVTHFGSAVSAFTTLCSVLLMSVFCVDHVRINIY